MQAIAFHTESFEHQYGAILNVATWLWSEQITLTQSPPNPQHVWNEAEGPNCIDSCASRADGRPHHDSSCLGLPEGSKLQRGHLGNHNPVSTQQASEPASKPAQPGEQAHSTHILRT